MQRHRKDRIFNGVSDRFLRNIYGTRKGAVRLALLWRDFEDMLPALVSGETPMSVLDLGAGVGQISCRLAALGHQLTLVEPAREMQSLARRYWQEQGQDIDRVRWVTARVQELPDGIPAAQLVLAHALMEWLADPFAALPGIAGQVAPGGWLSLMFYNRHAAAWSNLMQGNLERVRRGYLRGRRKSLAPISPLEPQAVHAALEDLGFEVACFSGIRIFSDYMADPEQASLDEVIETEAFLSRQEPYRSLARYIHLLARKPAL